MAESSRGLWRFTMPGLTEEIFTDSCKELDLINFSPEFNVEISPKLGGITERDWLNLKSLCKQKTGASDDWEDLKHLPAYKKWQEELHELQFEGGTIGYKRARSKSV